jgi:hypothetical protein
MSSRNTRKYERDDARASGLDELDVGGTDVEVTVVLLILPPEPSPSHIAGQGRPRDRQRRWPGLGGHTGAGQAATPAAGEDDLGC